MVGKVRGLQPTGGPVRIRGLVHQHFNQKLGKWITRSWQSGNGGDTPARKAAREQFKQVVQMIKQATAEEVAGATLLTKNTPLLVRDVLMQAAYGKLLVAVTTDGKIWQGVRKLDATIQPLLDSLSTTPGAVIVRVAAGWIGIGPGTSGQVLAIDAATGYPAWKDEAGGGAVTDVQAGDGLAVSHDMDGVYTLSLADIAVGDILANLSGGSAPPESHSLSEVLDTLGAVQGDIIVRSSMGWTVLSVGDAGQVLISDGTSVAWATPGSGALVTEPSIASFTSTPVNPGFDPTMIFASSITLSNSNKTAQPVSSGPYNYAYGSPAVYTGRVYLEWVPGATSFEVVGLTGSAGHNIDLDVSSPGNFANRWAGQIGWSSDGKLSAVEYQSAGAPLVLRTVDGWAAGDRLCIAMDIDTGLIWCRVNSGMWNASGTADPATGVDGVNAMTLFDGAGNKLVWPGCNMGNTSPTSLYLLATDFTQAVPSGFAAWAH